MEINLAKWKRWSREFLPPDPLGGMQSGYARQYNPDQAFKIYLGGLLVSDLKFTIPEAKQILDDLEEWLVSQGYYIVAGNVAQQTAIEKQVQKYSIHIMADKKTGLFYAMRGILSNQPFDLVDLRDVQIRKEQYVESVIVPNEKNHVNLDPTTIRMVNITGLFNTFLKNLGLRE